MLRGIEEVASSPTMSGQYHQAIPTQTPESNVTSTPPGRSGAKSTRNRQPVSCAACRRSKLKCDRQKPCEACVRRGYRDQCFYEAAKVVPRKKRRSHHHAQERLKNLEALVLQIAQPADAAKTPASSVGSAGQPGLHASHTSNENRVMVQGNAPTYTGSTHWSAILENIQELKTVMVSEDASEDGHTDHPDVFDPDTLYLFSAPRPASIEAILEALPPKFQVDRYMSTYFKASYLVLPILHQGRFQRQYEDFWRDPLRAPPLWTSILFSILTTAATVNLMNQSTDVEGEKSRREELLAAAAQCLIIGNYGKPQEYVLEALIMFGQTKYLASLDPSREVALICAIAFRFAFEMGYHRDPEHFSHLNVVDGEMRRRMWAICRQIDLLQAFQLGLPTYIPEDSFDTRPFSNLADTDFDESSPYLPSSRPETEPTRILQFLVKCRMIFAFSHAFRSAISFQPISPEKVMELDREVREAQRTVPTSLQIRSIASSFADSSSVIMARIDIELLFRKTLCTLHRKAMIAGNAYSRETCRESAFSILTHLVDLRRELQPGGQLAQDQWLMSCYTMHDFLLAAMLLCLIVSQRRKGNADEKSRRESQEEIAMIREAYHATHLLSNASREARRVSNVLASMLASLENFSTNAAHQHRKQDQDHAAAVAFPAANIAPEAQFIFEHDPFENLSSIPADIDWAYLDEYYLNMNAQLAANANSNLFMYNTDPTNVVAMPPR